jgi:hypothetical protein
MGQPVKAIVSLAIAAVLTVGVSASPGGRDSGDGAVGGTWPAVPTHAIRGVVKSMSPTALVIMPSRRATSEMRFVLSPLTHREGPMTVGATVSVRYRVENQTFLATAVSTHPETQLVGRAHPH